MGVDDDDAIADRVQRNPHFRYAIAENSSIKSLLHPDLLSVFCKMPTALIKDIIERVLVAVYKKRQADGNIGIPRPLAGNA